VFNHRCTVCHGNSAISAGRVIPDLRFSKVLGDPDRWKKIVIDGALENQGMVSFASVIKPEEAEAVRAYVISRANDTYPGALK
jgi:quinohemoprotein ethanol dehydrogenase